MALLPIAIYPAPVLLKPARSVTALTDDIRRLLDDMAETMYAASGVGLAGPQVHQAIQVAVIDVGEPVAMTNDEREAEISRTSKLYQLINPVITQSSGSITWDEGCLSLPDLKVDVERHATVTVEALDANFQPLHIDAQGLLAVALQHEIDHLNGRLIIDQLSRLKRQMYLDKLRKKERE